MPKWFFKKLRSGGTTREPIQGEFFANEAISNSAEALVREGIQNTLDARFNGRAAEVRIPLSGNDRAVAAKTVGPYLQEIWPHLPAERSGFTAAHRGHPQSEHDVFEDWVDLAVAAFSRRQPILDLSHGA